MAIAEVTNSKVVDTLRQLGFITAAEKLVGLIERKRKLAIAYEHYRVVRSEKIAAFNAKLKRESLQGKEPYNARWKTLEMCPIANYPGIPPQTVLNQMSQALGRNCFDTFEVAYIKDVEDPIVFGRIHGCTDRFFIDQWDSDVSIKDILKDNEG